ncbi:hypothetical protein SAY86_029565 [Trapa natans]|uniref:gibberellin 2beta-dioxygenase n=1 Tax=Trapa natans TaxID=22666 RepID=A0AAN7R9R9_TRANT|nr:hypothetical protein SAY86_029565 [Trapa natans]
MESISSHSLFRDNKLFSLSPLSLYHTKPWTSMVGVAAPPRARPEKIQAIDLPVVDLSRRSEAAGRIVAACEKYGFFKVVNHGVPWELIASVEEQGLMFFNKPSADKLKAGPANPYGYGSKNIGFNGDIGEVEYLLLGANPNLFDMSQRAKSISNHDPEKFSWAMRAYIAALRDVVCEILELMAEGLTMADGSAFSQMIRAADDDSVLRLNYYPPLSSLPIAIGRDRRKEAVGDRKVGFGEHSDPQILTVLRSNDVDGLQISLEDGVWIPVPADPIALWINAMSNGRFLSVRHRVLTNPNKMRMSVAYFAAPPLHARIASPPELVTAQRPALYRPFTWAEYKSTAYSLQLSDTRLNLFRMA